MHVVCAPVPSVPPEVYDACRQVLHALAVHESLVPGLYSLSAAQSVHAFAALPAENVPEGHAVLLAPPSHQSPAGHAVQSLCVFASPPDVYDAARHVRHALLPVPLLYILSSPHGVFVEPPSHEWPSMHSVHVECLFVLPPDAKAVYEPDWHVRHSTAL